jgi:thymidylate synthase
MCNDLKNLGVNVELGEYHHHAGSMHIYERHYDMANKIIKNDAAVYYKKELPKIKLHSHVTLQYILSKELYLPRVSMSKDEIKEKSLELSKMLLEEVPNG